MLTAPPPCNKVPVLVSYHYIREWSDERIEALASNPHIELLIDSGAFSALNAGAEVQLDEYMQWLHRWKNRLFGYMLLDKLGSPEVSARNHQTMLDNGLNPIPIHVRGDSQERMDQLFEVSRYVALGGFRRPKVGWSSKGYVKLKMEWAAGRPVHWLGYTRTSMLPPFRPYSVDSSNIMSGTQYGLMLVYSSKGFDQLKYHHIEKMRVPTPALRRALAAVGSTFADLKDPRSWRCSKKLGQMYCEHLPHLITVWSHVMYSRAIQEQYGTRVFLATTGVYETPELVAHFANQTNPVADRDPWPVHVPTNPRSISEWYKNE